MIASPSVQYSEPQGGAFSTSLSDSRVASNRRDEYRLLDLCEVRDTFIGDAEGLYRPGLSNGWLLGAEDDQGGRGGNAPSGAGRTAMGMKSKIHPTHLSRCAYVYVRQSTAAQVEHNRESTDRQYPLVERAVRLGWAKDQVKVVDEDLAQPGQTMAARAGFTPG